MKLLLLTHLKTNQYINQAIVTGYLKLLEKVARPDEVEINTNLKADTSITELQEVISKFDAIIFAERGKFDQPTLLSQNILRIAQSLEIPTIALDASIKTPYTPLIKPSYFISQIFKVLYILSLGKINWESPLKRFESHLHFNGLKNSYKEFQLCCFRDAQAADYISGIIPIPKPVIGADPILLLQEESFKTLHLEAGIKAELNQGYTKIGLYIQEQEDPLSVELLHDLIRWLRDTGYQIVLIDFKEENTDLMQRVYKPFKHTSTVLMPDTQKPQTAFGLIKDCKLFITNTYEPLVLCINVLTPFLSINAEWNAEDILELMNEKNYSLRSNHTLQSIKSVVTEKLSSSGPFTHQAQIVKNSLRSRLKVVQKKLTATLAKNDKRK